MRSKENGLSRLIQWLFIVGMPFVFTACARQPGDQSHAASTALPVAESAQIATEPAQPPIEVTAESFGHPPAQDDIARQYTKASILIQEGETLRFDVTIPDDAEFTFAFDVATPAQSRVPEGQLRVDGEIPIADMQRFVFPIFYRSDGEAFLKDRYGNDALVSQVRDVRWSRAVARDVDFSQPYPLRIHLTSGEHQIELTLTEGTLYLGSVYLIPFSPYPSYDEYLTSQPGPDTTGFQLTLEAEQSTFKNDTSVRPSANRSLTVTPYDTYLLLMNTLGGESWIKSGSGAYYEFTVPADGFYTLTFRSLQNTRSNFTVFRRITLNGEVPFEEFNAVPFAYSADWVDVVMPYKVYLREGVNILGVEATNSPYFRAIETIQQSLLDINALALEIRKLTGNQRDPFKEWVISDYIPDIQDRLNTIAQNLIDDQYLLRAIDQSGASPESLTYQMAIDNLLFLNEDPDKIPVFMGRFSEGSGSASGLLGTLLPLLQNQPLALDKIVIHSPDIVPQTPGVSIVTSVAEDFKRFVQSFQPDPYQTIGAAEDELEVWVNRPRQYVNLLQMMADAYFTSETGIRVKFSIMPDEAKLILANAADIQPDVALGVSTDKPYELAIRNALYDLRSFDDFDSFIHIYSPGALLGYIINESVYAIPETQDCWVTFYRQDILDSLEMPVPETWTEVIEILPELQRYGMNYNTMLSSGAGQKNYITTAPYLFNAGAPLYSDGGFATGLQSEEAISGIRFMAESFTIYGMPLTTASFYQEFRYGTVPIGVSNIIETYVKLTTAAPEIGGLWNIAPYPATVLTDGTENRYTTGSAQTSLMFRNTDKPQEGWEFLKWWMSTETQVEFAEQLVLNYGREYMWFSANLEALNYTDIPEEHREIILDQWQWLQEPVRLPGSYMQERELSNIWNRIVFNGLNPRVAIDRSIIAINREITRKMEEFGYLQDGVRVREFSIPTIETVRAWMENADGNQ